jgi:prolyl-tRNA editing enzyme YbaK/EbsC (Cys-tRNA(Pro) deacylase)
MRIQHFLQGHRVPFEVAAHPLVFDAQHLAQAPRIPGREVAKTVLLRVDHDYGCVVAALPSTHMRSSTTTRIHSVADFARRVKAPR